MNLDLSERLILPHSGEVESEVLLPGSKSISNRALLLAALSEGKVLLKGILQSRDTRIMIAALESLGFTLEVDWSSHEVSVQGLGGKIPVHEAKIDVGNAGTAARFLTAFVALSKGGTYHFDGDPAMRRRPISGLLDALIHQGASVEFHGEPGCFPFTLRSSGLRGGPLPLDATASSQILSALLMVGPWCQSPLQIELKGGTVSWPFVEITLAMMREFGQLPPEVSHDRSQFLIPSATSESSPAKYAIEPDVTAASYFMVLPLIHGGWIRFPQIHPPLIKQGDIAFLDVLLELGLEKVEDPQDGLTLFLNSESAWKNRSPALTWENPRSFDFNAFSDTFLTLAALAPLFPGPIRIEGIAHTRHQETDRVSAMATELQRIGVAVEESEDALNLPSASGWRPPSGATPIETYDDHRVAMSFGILGSFDARGDQSPWINILNPGCCGKTFPSFFDVLGSSLHHS